MFRKRTLTAAAVAAVAAPASAFAAAPAAANQHSAVSSLDRRDARSHDTSRDVARPDRSASTSGSTRDSSSMDGSAGIDHSKDSRPATPGAAAHVPETSHDS